MAYLVGGRLQIGERSSEHYVCRAPLINQDSIQLPSYGEDKYHHLIILMRNHVFQVGAHEAESGLRWMIKSPPLQGHHCSRISLTFGSRVSSSQKSFRDGVQLSMD